MMVCRLPTYTGLTAASGLCCRPTDGICRPTGAVGPDQSAVTHRPRPQRRPRSAPVEARVPAGPVPPQSKWKRSRPRTESPRLVTHRHGHDAHNAVPTHVLAYRRAADRSGAGDTKTSHTYSCTLYIVYSIRAIYVRARTCIRASAYA